MTAFENMVAAWDRKLCGFPHPNNDVLGWTCERPAGHEGLHAMQIWEEWGDDE